MQPIRQALVDFTQRYEPAFREWEVLDKSDEALMDWQIELYPIASIHWSLKAMARLIITPEEEDVLVIELNDGHIYGLRCPPEVLNHATAFGLRSYLHGLLTPRAYVNIGEG